MPKISQLTSATSLSSNDEFLIVDNPTGVNKKISSNNVSGALGVADYASRSDAIAATIVSSIDSLRTRGYASDGDGGGGLYKRIDEPVPVQAWHFQSADGSYWELIEENTGVNVKQLGAKGDDATNDTSAIQNAMSFATGGIYFPAGIYICKNISLNKTNFFIHGPAATLKNNLSGADPLLVLNTAETCDTVKVDLYALTCSGTGGHIIAHNGGQIVHSEFDVDVILQSANAYKIYTNEDSADGASIYFTKFRGLYWYCGPFNTASRLWEFIASNNKMSAVSFDVRDIRPQGAGKFAYFESTAASGSSLNQITFENVAIERANNGFVTFKGCMQSGLMGCTFYDLNISGTIDDNLIEITNGSNNCSSEGSFVTNCYRKDGTLNTGIVDVLVGSDYVTLTNIGAQTSGLGVTVDCGSKKVVCVGSQDVTFNNAANQVLLDADNGTVAPSISVETFVELSDGTTVAGLPTPSVGMVARVTDASSPSIGSTVVGGGAAYALVNYNGAAWTVIGI